VFLSLKHTGRRTSLMIDPPNGRTPPLTPDAQNQLGVIPLGWIITAQGPSPPA
jgi:hypothetical protein